MTYKFIETADGSHSLKNTKLDETYHSVHGAIQESRYIFIHSGLNECSCNKIKILEIGFGTGLNAYLTLLETLNRPLDISYTVLELYPLNKACWSVLNYPEILSDKQDLFYELHTCKWNEACQLSPAFNIRKIQCDFTEYQPDDMYDLIYFDAFSPEKQPELWTENRFSEIFRHCNDNAILTTYCAKGSVKRALQSVGFQVEKLAGPPGKRHMLRGIKHDIRQKGL